MSYNKMEMMICAAARLLEDGRIAAMGTGAPCAAAMLAQKTHAPNLTLFFEAGGIAPLLPSMPISVGDSRTFHRAIMASSMAEMMSTGSRGLIDYAFLGGAQIDRYGNLNSTIVGNYEKPKVRFPGSGGANDFASFCWRTIIITVHEKSRFVETVDFITSPGYLTGPGAREAAGLPAGAGPYKIVTDLAVMGFDPDTKVMRIESLHPGVDVQTVRDNTGFELPVVADVAETPAPSAEELRRLRDEVDPRRLIIGR
ncbi:CoA-transferase subunit beta [Shumkonia mesophila]|uniref:CoA-transferase subunit beta n=1 Tax=Shumkonia mesophila TaxID=2838854 RepID=UPI00293449A5|nr:CoA-transferase [Shumkonia mesophila]